MILGTIGFFQLEAASNMKPEPMAIIGMSYRFPGAVPLSQLVFRDGSTSIRYTIDTLQCGNLGTNEILAPREWVAGSCQGHVSQVLLPWKPL